MSASRNKLIKVFLHFSRLHHQKNVHDNVSNYLQVQCIFFFQIDNDYANWNGNTETLQKSISLRTKTYPVIFRQIFTITFCFEVRGPIWNMTFKSCFKINGELTMISARIQKKKKNYRRKQNLDLFKVCYVVLLLPINKKWHQTLYIDNNK